MNKEEAVLYPKWWPIDVAESLNMKTKRKSTVTMKAIAMKRIFLPMIMRRKKKKQEEDREEIAPVDRVEVDLALV